MEYGAQTEFGRLKKVLRHHLLAAINAREVPGSQIPGYAEAAIRELSALVVPVWG